MIWTLISRLVDGLTLIHFAFGCPQVAQPPIAPPAMGIYWTTPASVNGYPIAGASQLNAVYATATTTNSR